MENEHQILDSKTIKDSGDYRKCGKWASYFGLKNKKELCSLFHFTYYSWLSFS